ncbi:hypothetical protein OPAG_06769 [Rhodococcus opacus PD630]|nr:hypothetical protein Pd630_LPD15028 [Rhodococcus opacus PD630]EHI43491.1 hypothetical protein OPAG_06769 [Rhodococcus opacus PD630]
MPQAPVSSDAPGVVERTEFVAEVGGRRLQVSNRAVDDQTSPFVVKCGNRVRDRSRDVPRSGPRVSWWVIGSRAQTWCAQSIRVGHGSDEFFAVSICRPTGFGERVGLGVRDA